MPNAFTRKECDYLEKKGKESFEAHSKDGFHFGEDPLKRSSQISWVDDKMSVAMVEELAHTANIDAGWVLDLVRSEAIQYTVYAEGDEYDCTLTAIKIVTLQSIWSEQPTTQCH